MGCVEWVMLDIQREPQNTGNQRGARLRAADDSFWHSIGAVKPISKLEISEEIPGCRQTPNDLPSACYSFCGIQ
jgi:hypothetical protein